MDNGMSLDSNYVESQKHGLLRSQHRGRYALRCDSGDTYTARAPDVEPSGQSERSALRGTVEEPELDLIRHY